MSKFLTFEDRLTIEKGLRENLSFGAIAKELGKDRTTIAKEIKKYAYDLKSGYSRYPYNACTHRVACKTKKVCGNACTHTSSYKCSICNKCNDNCPDFVEADLFRIDAIITPLIKQGQSVIKEKS